MSSYEDNMMVDSNAPSDELMAQYEYFDISNGNGADRGEAAVPTLLHNLPTVRLNNQKRASLPAGYVPGDLDVICGRGKKNWNHRGNVHFRSVIRTNVQRYMDASSKNDKTLVVISIVDEIRSQSGRFLNEDMYGRWYDIGDTLARDKVGHSLRDQVTALNRQKLKKGIFRSKDGDDYDEDEDEYADDPLLAAVLKAPEPIPAVAQRRGSFHSDTGSDVAFRRSSDLARFIVSTLTRRPSFLAFSFGSRSETRQRASTLMGGDLTASMALESFRNSSNYDFLDNLEDLDAFQMTVDDSDSPLDDFDLERPPMFEI